MTRTEILLRDGRVEVSNYASTDSSCAREMGTILANLAHYGYTVSAEVYEALGSQAADTLADWWGALEPALKKITGDDLPMAEFVVYKNFPKEVMSMTEADYWCRQILMYIGYDKYYFTAPAKERDGLDQSKLDLHVLQLATSKDCERILRETSGMQAQWNEDQFDTVAYLVFQENLPLDLAEVPFKENLARLMGTAINLGVQLEARTATDVLRVATAMSDGDTRFVTSTRFRRFTRRERRGLLGMLEKCQNLTEDAYRYVERFKRLLRGLHPNDYVRAYPRTTQLQADLFNRVRPTTFNGQVEAYLAAKNVEVLELLMRRPGEFARRLRHTIELFGMQAVYDFMSVMDQLSTQRLLTLGRMMQKYNGRKQLIYPPKGQWANAKFVERTKEFKEPASHYLVNQINDLVATRLQKDLPQGAFDVDSRLCRVKLPNGGDLLPYGRGTEFEIPEDVNFIRTASYWRLGPGQDIHNIWYDNGFNFFDSEWNSKGNIAWNNPQPGKHAAFSGDPCSSQTADGQATQVIDLYLDELQAQGIRYAVWNVLCFSGVPFSWAMKVQSAMQWGDDTTKGELFEPSRSVMTFPLTGEGKTKYIAMIDVEKRTIMYLDANLAGTVSSAGANDSQLEKIMPAFMEYINQLPSMWDLLILAPQTTIGEGVTFVYQDDEDAVTGSAYVFNQVNPDSQFESFDVTDLLNSTRKVKKKVRN